MSARPAARDPFAFHHRTTGAGAEAQHDHGMSDALAWSQRAADRGVGPEDAGHGEIAQDACPALGRPSSAPLARTVPAGASGGGRGFGRLAPAAGGPSDVEPPDDARQAIPGKPGEARGGPES